MTEDATKGPRIFGLDLKDPQDLISIFLIGLIVFNGVDIVWLTIQRAAGIGAFAPTN